MQLKNLLKLIDVSVSVGCFFNIEQPKSSLMLKVPEIEHLIEQNIVSKIDFDQCAYGLRPLRAPGTEGNNDTVKKPTNILTNMPKAFLHRTCDGTHRHEHAIGAVRLEGR